MPDTPKAVWRNQPEEKFEMNLQYLNRRTQELRSGTRSEILTSIAAAVFFVAVLAWRFALAQDRLQQVGLSIVIAWVLVSLCRFRDRIWSQSPQPMDHVSETGLKYYRKELEQRRDHLRNIWLWHGPVFLACLIFLATFVGKGFPNSERLLNVLPLVILLALWTVWGFMRRRRQANQIQQEIDELSSL
jgi:lipopolysaccharide export LptBFGC system permease protein LptF